MKEKVQKILPYEVLLDQLISVNAKDEFVSAIDKWHAHSNIYISQKQALPHRAFSIFIFNHRNQLLLQKRSLSKKTFPLCWTNSCCSHPNMIKIKDGAIKQEPIRESLHRALQRQLRLDLSEHSFYYMNKILYKKQGSKGKQDFGQFQMDYVYLNKVNEDILFEQNPDEVADVKWINRQQIPNFMKEILKNGGYFSPWFEKMQQSGLLTQWWNKIEKGQLKDQEGQTGSKIMNML